MYGGLGPPLNKKLFPVHRPGGLKRAEWDFFLFFSCYSPLPVHSSVYKNGIRRGGGIPTSRLAFFKVTQRTGNDFLLKDGLSNINNRETNSDIMHK